MLNRLKRSNRSNRSINVPIVPNDPTVPSVLRLERLHRLERLERKTGGFTLIELLVATFIFVMLITVGMASMTVMWHSKSKLSGSKTIQEAGRLSMEMMANEVKKANSNLTVDGDIYKKFYISDDHSTLKVSQNNAEKTFTLNGTNATMNDANLTSSDVLVTALTFDGQDGRDQDSNPYIEPYVTIQMAVKTTSDDVNKKANAVFRTTVISGDLYGGKIFNVALPYVYIPAVGCSSVDDGYVYNIPKSLTPASDKTNIVIGKCYSSRINVASDGDFLYFGYNANIGASVHKWSANSTSAKLWFYTGIAYNINFRGDGYDIAADSKYLYSFNDSSDFLCKEDKKDPTSSPICASSISASDGTFRIEEKDIGASDNEASMTVMEDTANNKSYVYLANSDKSWIYKIDVTSSNPSQWEITNYYNGNPKAAGIVYDQFDNKIWTVGDGGLCRWDTNLTTYECRTTIDGKNINGSDVTTDNDYIYIVGISGGKSGPRMGALRIKKDTDMSQWTIEDENPSIQVTRITTGIYTRYVYGYE